VVWGMGPGEGCRIEGGGAKVKVHTIQNKNNNNVFYLTMFKQNLTLTKIAIMNNNKII
jgi:hypothetical protein